MKKLLLQLIELFFPQICTACKKISQPLCQICFEKIKRNQDFKDGVIFATTLKDNPILRKTIHNFKYKGVKSLAKRLVELFEEVPTGVFIPVPLHKKRAQERGFNQALLIANELKLINTTSQVADILIRAKATENQAYKSRTERLHNLQNAFGMRDAETKLDPSQQYFVVDDVSTTGTTVRECSQVLRKHGAKYITGIVIAHDPRE